MAACAGCHAAGAAQPLDGGAEIAGLRILEVATHQVQSQIDGAAAAFFLVVVKKLVARDRDPTAIDFPVVLRILRVALRAKAFEHHLQRCCSSLFDGGGFHGSTIPRNRTCRQYTLQIILCNGFL